MRITSPRFPRRNDGEAKCLSFSFNVYGENYGRLRMMDENEETKWQLSLSTPPENTVRQWFHAEMTLSTSQKYFTFEGAGRGLANADIAIDNLLLERLSCDTSKKIRRSDVHPTW